MDFTGESITKILAACPWLKQNLHRYNRWETARLLAGLLTIPECQPNTIRLETLVHIVVATARGARVPRRDDLVVWFNRHFSVPSIAAMEDPLEDVMVSNVVDVSGNHRIFEGIWESNAYWLQCLLHVLEQMPPAPEISAVLRSAAALLDLSNAVAERLGLERNSAGAGEPKGKIPLPHFRDLETAADAVMFSTEDLRQMEIEPSALEPFIFRDGSESEILGACLEHSPLERCPLLARDGVVLLVLPSAIGIAIRRHALEVLQSLNSIRQFEMMLLAKQAADLTKDALHRIGGRPWQFEEMPTNLDARPPANLLLIPFRFDRDRYGLICVIASPLAHDTNHRPYPTEILGKWTSTQAYLQKVTEAIASVQGFKDGLMILTGGGLGGVLMLPTPELSTAWKHFSISVPNMLTLASVPDMDLSAIYRFAKQVELAQKNGIQILSPNGDFNLISVWREQHYHVLPPEVSIHTTLFLPQVNAILGTRLEVRTSRDLHASWRGSTGQWFIVERKGAFSSFATNRRMPLYVSPDLVQEGELAAVVEVGPVFCWMTSNFRGHGTEERSAAYQLWDCLAHWLVPVLERLGNHFMDLEGTCELRLAIPDLDVWSFDAPYESEQHVPLAWSHQGEGVAEIAIDQRFFRTFYQPANTAEREIVKILIESVCGLLGQEFTAEEIARMRDTIIPEGNARYFHVTTVTDASFAAAPGPAVARLVRKEVIAEQWENLGLAERDLIGRTIIDRASIRNVVRRSTSRLKDAIGELLRPLSLRRVVEECYTVMDSLHRDDHTWKVSAAALLAMHPDAQEVYDEARTQESKRAAAGLAARSIMETALYSCRVEGGSELSRATMDELLAKMQVLIEVANHDPIDWAPDFPAGKVSVTESGTLLPENPELTSIRNAYHLSMIDARFESDAASYDERFRDRQERELPGDFASFDAAMEAEFGLSARRMVDLAGLLNARGTREATARWPMLRSELMTYIRDEVKITEAAAHRFVEQLTLGPRHAWDDLPPGCEQKDTFPWLFKRRLSLLRRPFVQVTHGDDPTYIVAPTFIRQASLYLMTNVHEGEFPRDFYSTQVMREYHDTAIKRRSDAFVERTATTMRAAGYEVRPNVKMTVLGAPELLGDIDVLAWRVSPPETVVIECKALSNALSVQEVIAQLEKFKAAGRDSLGKHVDRMQWMEQNRAVLDRFTNIAGGVFYGAIATSHKVPMQFAPENLAAVPFWDLDQMKVRFPPA